MSEINAEYQVALDRSLHNCRLLIRDYGGERLHLIQATGTIGLNERLAAYEEFLKGDHTDNFFYIVDNRGGNEIRMSSEDIGHQNDLLIEKGIRYVRGAVVTPDKAYSGLISLAHAKAQASNFDVELISTDDMAEAEKFVLSKLFQLKSIAP